MIRYDLKCKACGTVFEVYQDMNAKGPFRCEKCGKKRAYRAFTTIPAFHAHYSPAHPRAGRGRGIGRKPLI